MSKTARNPLIALYIPSALVLVLIVEFPFKDTLLVGILAGIFNIIPYLGPVMGTLFGLFTGIVSYLQHPNESNIFVLAVLIIVVFMVVQFIDNMLIRPYVYSNSVPAYSVLRVFAKQFFSQFIVVQSLTRNI
jgi:predicted PurR-regulated permease PerM